MTLSRKLLGAHAIAAFGSTCLPRTCSAYSDFNSEPSLNITSRRVNRTKVSSLVPEKQSRRKLPNAMHITPKTSWYPAPILSLRPSFFRSSNHKSKPDRAMLMMRDGFTSSCCRGSSWPQLLLSVSPFLPSARPFPSRALLSRPSRQTCGPRPPLSFV